MDLRKNYEKKSKKVIFFFTTINDSYLSVNLRLFSTISHDSKDNYEKVKRICFVMMFAAFFQEPEETKKMVIFLEKYF